MTDFNFIANATETFSTSADAESSYLR